MRANKDIHECVTSVLSRELSRVQQDARRSVHREHAGRFIIYPCTHAGVYINNNHRHGIVRNRMIDSSNSNAS